MCERYVLVPCRGERREIIRLSYFFFDEVRFFKFQNHYENPRILAGKSTKMYMIVPGRGEEVYYLIVAGHAAHTKQNHRGPCNKL